MFTFATIIGIYSYLIFSLGLLGILYKANVVIVSAIYIAVLTYLNRNVLKIKILQYFQVLKKCSRLNFVFKLNEHNNILLLLFFILLLQALVNLIGTLGPELGFDALWYHLTLPKIYLQNHAITHIPGGLLYYSDMPKLTEMLYAAALTLSNEIGAKLIHFSFGILSCIALYKLSRKFFSSLISLLVVVVFYSNLVVAWQSITAYIDLARTFFEMMALWGFLNWWETKKKRWLIVSAVMLGFALSTKLLAIGSLFIFSILIVVYFLHKKIEIKNLFIGLFVYWFICLLIPLPWFVFSFIHTGNPISPFFTEVYKVDVSFSLLSPLRFISDTWTLFTGLADPVSPVYIIFLPLVFVFFTRLSFNIKLISFYSFLAIIVWYITPRTGGGRFILPYLPAFSIIVGAVVQELTKRKSNIPIKNLFIPIIIFVSLISILYRGAANFKFIPFIIGKETKKEFLTKNLNFMFGDFYDTDGYFKKNIKKDDIVLLYGFHNLYYIDFPFVDSSWIKKGDKFNYIAVQNTDLPKQFKNLDLIYKNPITHVNLYSKGRKKWTY